MTIALMLLFALVLLAAMFYLTVCVNEFEKAARTLGTRLQKRYHIDPPRKAPTPAEQMKAMVKVPLPGSKP